MQTEKIKIHKLERYSAKSNNMKIIHFCIFISDQYITESMS